MTQDLQKGTVLADRYTLLRKLGAGADTQTWLATDRMTRASVALKVRSSERITADTLRKEWQTSIRLMHAHIVRVFEFHDDTDRPFYSLQFVDGADINVLSGAPLSDLLPPLALVADALRYAHSKSVVHRDIKASNILLDQNGAPYLADFVAAAKSMDTATGGSHQLGLGVAELVVEPPQHAERRARVIVLDEVAVNSELGKLPSVEGLHEETPGVLVDLGREHLDPPQGLVNQPHRRPPRV